MELPHVPWFRSVAWDTVQNRPLSISPCHHTTTPFPYSSLASVGPEMICEEWIDGFLIHCYPLEDGTYQILSRSKWDASGVFYSKKTFRELFLEALPMKDVAALHRAIVGTDTVSAAAAHCSMSFVVQHPENRLVARVDSPRAYLIQVASVHPDGTVDLADHFDPVTHHGIPLFSVAAAAADAPYRSYAQAATATEAVEDWMEALYQKRSWECQGVVWKDHAGHRWRSRSSKYAAVKSLRGNHPSIIDRFASLYVQDLQTRYMEYYPEESFGFAFHSAGWSRILETLYQAYMDIYVMKRKKKTDVDSMYHPHLFNLHRIYLQMSKGSGSGSGSGSNHEKAKLKMSDVVLYAHSLPWQRIAFLLRKTQHAYFQEHVHPRVAS